MDSIQENKDLFLYTTAGGSMFPFIRWREYVIVKKVAGETLQPGDVVVFREDSGHAVCHRIVAIDVRSGKRWFRTKGDQRREDDAPVPEQAILGKVIAVRKKYGLLEPASPEWASYADPRGHRLSRSLFRLKTRLKRMVDFFRISGP